LPFPLLLFCSLFSKLYGGEGLNIPLMFLPTRYIPSLLRKYGATIGDHVRIRTPFTIHNSAIGTNEYYRNLTIGSDCYIGRECMIDLEDKVTIENKVTLSHRIMIATHTNAGESPLAHSIVKTTHAPVTLRMGAYIGVNVTILEGVEIGECAIIGAGAVVTKSIPANSIAVGIPAKIIKTYPSL